MGLFILCLLFALGLILIIKGGDYFVDAASWIAEVSGIPKVIVGATVVSLATTLPEVIVSVIAALSGSADIAVGNAVGSVTANLGLAFGLCALLAPFAFRREEYAVKGILLVLAVSALFFFSFSGSLSLPGVALLFCVFIAFLAENIYSAKAASGQSAEERPRPARRVILRKGLDFVIGIAGIVAGAQLLVRNGSRLALSLGIPESVVAVTIVAVGTSLPELVTCVASIVKRQGALSVGNILGASIIDTTLIVPLCGFLTGQALPITGQGLGLDLPACLIIALAAALPLLFSAKTSKRQGVSLLALYGVYVVMLVIKTMM